MSKFDNKSTTIRITANADTFNLICDDNELLNYLAGSPYALCNHFSKVLLQTLLSMKENQCKTIKIDALWE